MSLIDLIIKPLENSIYLYSKFIEFNSRIFGIFDTKD